ncbi:DNA polymerase III subunit beta [Candidatus Gottesmanbacteria bacterium]|nr:DNA polymerase III subunit beta [Candidatus Gottesmanbacteria bacterium]
MKISVLQENLHKALGRVGRNISAKPQLPALLNILIETIDGRLCITSTNLDTTERVFIGAKIEEEGAVCIPARTLIDLVSSLKQGNIEIVSEKEKIIIKASGVKATLPGTLVDEFPKTASPAGQKEIRLEKESVLDALNLVVFSAAGDTSRPLLSGVKVSAEEGLMTFAATDGYRLCVKTITVDKDVHFSNVIPARVFSEVVKIAQEEKDEKDIVISLSSDGQALFRIGDTELLSRAIDGEYPVYQKIIPKNHTSTAVFDTEELLSAVRSASIFARDNANIIKLHVEKNASSVSSNSPQAGEGTIDVAAEVDGEGGDIAYNSRFLVDYLSHISSDRVVFEMTGSLNPGVFRIPEDDSYLSVIMPVRVQG